jgi:hypothetical protein
MKKDNPTMQDAPAPQPSRLHMEIGLHGLHGLELLALLPQFYLIFDTANRMHLLWDRPYHAAILCALVLLGSIYFAFAWFTRRLPAKAQGFRAALGCVFILYILIRTLVAMVDRTGHLPVALQSLPAKLILYFGLPALISVWAPRTLLRGLRNVVLCASPLVILLAVAPLTYRTFDKGDMRGLADVVGEQDRAPAGTVNPGGNVFIFVFDEWDYFRAFGDGSTEATMPRTRAWLSDALFFEQARSASSGTFVSMPKMLLPTSPQVKNQSYAAIEQAMINGSLRSQGDSLFDLFPDDYLKVLSGFGLNYAYLLGDSVDHAISYRDAEAYFRTFPGELKRLLLSQVDWLRYAGIRLHEHLPIGGLIAQQKVHEDALFALRQLQRPMVAVFHYCLPRHPFAWTEHGQKEHLTAAVKEPTVENYMGNLARLDQVIDELLTAIRATGGENDLIILTSDHGWRYDPDRGHFLEHEFPSADIDADPDSTFRHVPLIVFGQPTTPAGRVATPYPLADLHDLIQRHLDGQPVVDAALIR